MLFSVTFIDNHKHSPLYLDSQLAGISDKYRLFSYKTYIQICFKGLFINMHYFDDKAI